MSRLDPGLAAAVEAATGRPSLSAKPLSGGCIAEVLDVGLEGGGRVVAKRSRDGGLAEEARMLADLRRLSELPVPAVLHASDDLLLLEYVEGGGRLEGTAQAHAADLLAALHEITGPRFGYERDTLIGPLRQPNPWTGSWRDFFRDQRLLYMGSLAREAGRLAPETHRRLESFCATIERYVEEPARPSLIHGDVWDGNILVRGGRVAAFLDPAIYYGDPEVELAFGTLFGTLNRDFFERYREHRPIAPGFFEVRREVYTLYPLLVHATLFGGGYAASVEAILARHG